MFQNQAPTELAARQRLRQQLLENGLGSFHPSQGVETHRRFYETCLAGRLVDPLDGLSVVLRLRPEDAGHKVCGFDGPQVAFPPL